MSDDDDTRTFTVRVETVDQEGATKRPVVPYDDIEVDITIRDADDESLSPTRKSSA